MYLGDRSLERANPSKRAVLVFVMRSRIAHGQSQPILDRFQQLGQRDCRGVPSQGIAAFNAAVALNKPAMAEFFEDVGYKGVTDAKLLGNSSRCASTMLLMKVRKNQEGIVCLAAQ